MLKLPTNVYLLLFFTMRKGFQAHKKVDIEQFDTPLRT
jgi:hypothetical protein